jgi:hypothetical protein
MTNAAKLWGRVQEELRTASERTRKGAERAVRTGVLQVDLVSLRRDKNRAQANLGERVLALWSQGNLDSLTTDPEVLRTRALVQTIDERIAAKEAELTSLRAPAPDAADRHEQSPDPDRTGMEGS